MQDCYCEWAKECSVFRLSNIVDHTVFVDVMFTAQLVILWAHKGVDEA